MSGIIGVFNFDGRGVTPSELRTLGSPLAHRGADGEDFWICGSFGLGHQHSRITPESLTEQQPLVSPTGIAVSFDGRLDNRDELANLCGPHALESRCDASDAVLVLAAYERAGDSFVSGLNGDFALALFDSRRKQLVLARDVMGLRPLYYCSLPSALLFASSIKSLLAHPQVATRPDEDGIADLVLDKWDDGHHTCFTGIRSVPPGHLLVATPDSVAIRQHWSFDPASQIRCHSIEEYAEAFRAVFARAVRRRLRGVRGVAVAVSGGIDSSSIFCQAAALKQSEGVPATLHGISLTFPAGNAADEQEFLDEIDSASDTRIARVPISRVRLLVDADRVVGHLEMPGVLWDATGEVYRRAQQTGSSVILEGYFGDQVLFGRWYLVDLARRARWLKVRHDLRQFSSWMTDAAGLFGHEFRNTLLRSIPPRWLFRTAKNYAKRSRSARYLPLYRKEFLERLLDRQMSRFESHLRFASRHAEEYYRHATAGHDLSHVEQLNRLGRMHGIDVWFPFRDRDLVAFLMAIPGDVVNWGGIPKGLLRQALAGILPARIRNRRWKADFSSVSLAAVLHEHSNMARLLTRDCLSVRAGFVDGDVVEQSVSALKTTIAETGDTMAAWQLNNLVGLELWLRHFFGHQLGLVGD